MGGTAGLFLGCSVLSIMEIFYFFTLKAFFYVMEHCYGDHKEESEEGEEEQAHSDEQPVLAGQPVIGDPGSAAQKPGGPGPIGFTTAYVQ